MYKQPIKLSKKKKIEIALLITFLLWTILFLVNYFRYTKSTPPIFAIHSISEYEDGTVDEYISLGYIYRSYNRNSITREELVPFWIGKENPESISDLPETHKGYTIPANPEYESKYKGILYYYDSNNQLIGTYKCINTKSNCDKAFSGHDSYNLKNQDPLTAITTKRTMHFVYKKYAFIDDSREQELNYGDNAYDRTIYLFDVKNNKIIAKYSDIKESKYDTTYKVSTGDNYKYIVKHSENKKWGLIEITEEGEIKEILPFEYESISFDADTGFYIMLKDTDWYVYDLQNDNKLTENSLDPIYNVWENSNKTYYYKIGTKRTIGEESYIEYKINKLDGTPFLNQQGITGIVAMNTYIYYISKNTNQLIFMDYSGEIKYTIPLNFYQLDEDEFTHPAFEITYHENTHYTIRVYNGRDISESYKTYSFSTQTW